MDPLAYKITCSIAPPSVVYISDGTVNSEFVIEFKKVRLSSGDYSQCLNTENVRADVSGGVPTLSVLLNIGPGISDICTKDDIRNLSL